MTIYQEIQAKLEAHPKFRERALRDEYLVVLALRSLDLEETYNSGRTFPKKDMAEFAKKYDTMRHEWDAVMRENPTLRGSDYEDGKALAQAKCAEFRYTPSLWNEQETLEDYITRD